MGAVVFSVCIIKYRCLILLKSERFQLLIAAAVADVDLSCMESKPQENTLFFKKKDERNAEREIALSYRS